MWLRSFNHLLTPFLPLSFLFYHFDTLQDTNNTLSSVLPKLKGFAFSAVTSNTYQSIFPAKTMTSF